MILFRWRQLCLAVLLMPASIFAQSQTITLEQAVELTKQNSLQLELFRQEKLQKQGEAIQSSAWPNPQFRVSREQLNRGTIDYNETTIQISQPVEILGQSFLRNRRSSHIEYAAELEFRYSGDLLKERVRMLYTEYWKTKNIVRAYDETLDAAKAWLDDRTNRINTISAYNKALFELDRMTSGIILSNQNHSEQ
jgi:outer membrane protein, heavy metal efflux system